MKTFLMPLISTLLIIGGLLLIKHAFNLAKLKKESLNWPFVEGIILKSELLEFGKAGHQHYDAEIIYEYVVKSIRYTGSKIYLTISDIKHKAEANKFTDRYKKGDAVDVFYKPDTPSNSVLETGVREGRPSNEYATGIVVLIIGVGSVFLYLESFNELYNLLIN